MTSGPDAADIRRRAEEALKVKTEVTEAPLSALDNQKLVHELQVHQIELEMQNDELRHAQAETNAALARYTDLYDFAPLGYFTLDVDDKIVEINLAGAKLLGQVRASLIGGRLAAFVGDTDLPIFAAFLRQVFAVALKQSCEVTLECEGQSPRTVHLEATLSPDGSHCRVLVDDITERKKLEGQLRQSQRMEAVGQLTGGIAHDYNNILAVIIGNAEILPLKESLSDASLQYVNAIIGAVRRGSSLTDRLLAFSRQQVLSPASTKIEDIIGSLEEMLRRTLGETIDLKFDYAPDLWPALTDPHQFENALVNLALNARDAMPHVGVLTIETTNVTLDNTYAIQHGEVEPGEYVKVAVSDTGAGIASEIMEKVFEPFFTTKEVGHGSGLGLSMVFGFAKQSKGHVAIDSELGHGTTVELYMPRSMGETTKEISSIEDNIIAPGSERILVVEDDEDVCAVSVSVLSEQGYDVHSVVDGYEAIEKLQGETAFDLLFIDVVLPGGMNGVDIAKQAEQLQPNIKVLFTTGHTENTIVHNGILDQRVTLIKKPYRRNELLAEVSALLHGKSILLIDDDEGLRNTLVSNLENKGHTVTAVSGGSEGLKILQSENFDVIISDIVMEEGEGMEVLFWIKSHRSDIPLIMVSGYPAYLDSAAKLGAASVLKKPFQIDELMSTIRDVTRLKTAS